MVKILLAKDANVELRDDYGYSAAYWAHRHKHADIVALLPPPQKISKEEYYEHIMNVWKMHPDVMKGGKKKKKKGGKKKK